MPTARVCVPTARACMPTTQACMPAAWVVLIAAAWGVSPQASAAPMPDSITVFASASLTEAVTELAGRHRQQTGHALRLSFASASTLARQIENGAAADIFLSADEEWMRYLDERGLVARDTWVRPIGNRLVMIAPADRAARIELRNHILDEDFDLAATLGDGRLAVGDPAHVPAGRYAQQALKHVGLWAAAEPRLARAENVRAALALVERGEAPLGIVYATDARAASNVRVVYVFPVESHAPIRYSFAAIKGRDAAATRAVLAFLTSAAAMRTYAALGFETR